MNPVTVLSSDVANAWFQGLAEFVFHLTGTKAKIETIPYGVKMERGIELVHQNFQAINQILATRALWQKDEAKDQAEYESHATDEPPPSYPELGAP